ncbi:hypothetical protein AAY72_01675 [Alishewanella sp. WH16-1]|uniref:hypothetical protein n=1 Tax=Alishewanella sp. WH16-1 TaxID=1651088 RepID=UPI00070F96F5|nr:hypothetical protein [Alishewanella sp. WH16-1]KRS22847.1 hypothetical protein AAY72_01675 [Alishewanella sp. WH16-1]
MTNAALKMAAPGELCAHSKKLMAFCQTTARSLKAMRQHIGVTHERMDALLRDMLAQRLIWKQSNGMYKTCTNKLQFLDEQPAANSLLALADDAEQAKYDADLNNQWDTACTVADGELAAAEANALEQMATEASAADDDVTELDIDIAEQQLGTSFATAPEFEPATYDLGAMAAEFEAEQERGDTHQVDNITAKQRAINYCQMLLSPKSTELRRCLDELQMDLAVIALQQERMPA